MNETGISFQYLAKNSASFSLSIRVESFFFAFRMIATNKISGYHRKCKVKLAGEGDGENAAVSTGVEEISSCAYGKSVA
ncbi:MAG: hypothetical protein JSR46_04330 [Verrucomicrobia bacterium]|nr:hypothetical protein [Verrucomicrobiota bacterium]